MKTTTLMKTLSAALAISLCAFGMAARAQTASPAMPAASDTKPAANDGVVDKTKRAAKKTAAGTKRVARKTADATKRGANRAAGAVRNTGEKIGNKLPPGPKDDKINETGQPKTAP